MATKRLILKNEKGSIMGFIDTNTKTGDMTAKDINGNILGFYRKKENYTKDIRGRILTIGDTLAALISQAYEKTK